MTARVEPAAGERRVPQGVGVAAPTSVITFPPPDLADRIDLSWSATGGGGGTALHEFFPDAGVHLVFRLSDAEARAVLLGPATERACVERAPGAEYLGIRFRAGQAPRLADVRSSDLTDGLVELTRLGGLPIETVAERIRALPDSASRQRFLMAIVSNAARPLIDDERCRRATFLLESRRGQLQVGALAAELGLHVRSLERLFLDAFGMTPKRMARLVRLRYVLGALHSGGFRTLADLAHACGYSDQPHLIHDFKRLTNRLPGERDAFRNRLLERADTRVVHRVRPGQAVGDVSHSHKTGPSVER